MNAGLIILFGGFLYWAYIPDYRRNPKEFCRTLIGMPIGMFLSGIGFKNLSEQLRKWATGEKSKKNSSKSYLQHQVCDHSS